MNTIVFRTSPINPSKDKIVKEKNNAERINGIIQKLAKILSKIKELTFCSVLLFIFLFCLVILIFEFLDF
jgi:hypothetical protein